jgi:predicted tellurium resistance membrane protein TerC
VVEIDILKILLTPDNLSIFLYYFIPGYLFFAFIRFKEFFGLREKWKIITGLDMIIFSIIVSIAFSLNFMLIFYAIINYSAVIISILGILLVQLPVHYFEKKHSYKTEYAYLIALSIAVTIFSEFVYNAPFSFIEMLSPSFGIFFFLLVFKILRFKLMETIRPESKNEIRFI